MSFPVSTFSQISNLLSATSGLNYVIVDWVMRNAAAADKSFWSWKSGGKKFFLLSVNSRNRRSIKWDLFMIHSHFKLFLMITLLVTQQCLSFFWNFYRVLRGAIYKYNVGRSKWVENNYEETVNRAEKWVTAKAIEQVISGQNKLQHLSITCE